MSTTDSSLLKTMITIIAGLFGFMIIIIILANVLTSGSGTDPQKDSMVQDAVNERIKPVGQVNTGGAAPMTAAAAPAAAATPSAAAAPDGQATYTQSCFACHGTGAAGAPKLGDNAAWTARIAQGNDTLYDHALKGFKAMPPKGGNMGLSDDAVKAAVDYLVANSQ